MAEPVQRVDKYFFDGADGLARIAADGPQDAWEVVGQRGLTVHHQGFDRDAQVFRLSDRELSDAGGVLAIEIALKLS